MGADLKHAAALDNSVERLIASSAQSSAVVSQGFGGDMAAGAAEVGAAGEATRGVGRLACTHALGGGPIGVASPTDDL